MTQDMQVAAAVVVAFVTGTAFGMLVLSYAIRAARRIANEHR